ncbi:MAG: hypothetical protein AB1714_07310 [Acidobacteriota bacterium]
MKPKGTIGAGHRLEKVLEATIRRVTTKKPATTPLNVRLTDDERGRLEHEAKKRGLPTATFAKTLILASLDSLAEEKH